MATDVTDGDWEVFQTKSNRHVRIMADLDTENEDIVANVMGDTPEQALANAYLMAAAKKLQAALQRVASYLEEFPDCDGASHGVPLSLLIDDALAAAQPPR